VLRPVDSAPCDWRFGLVDEANPQVELGLEAYNILEGFQAAAGMTKPAANA